jgi:hypothetical protein
LIYERSNSRGRIRNTPLSTNPQQSEAIARRGGKPIIEWVVDNLQGVPDLETIYVVTNDKFARTFRLGASSIKIDIRNSNSKLSTMAPRTTTISLAQLEISILLSRART